jgi:uncharacterized protein (TIGR02145 family)
MKQLLLLSTLVVLIIAGGCKKKDDPEPTPTTTPTGSSGGFTQGNGVTDIDGNTYNTIVLGTQEWMQENLRTTQYANGDTIPNVTDGTQWSGLPTGAWCHYNNDSQYETPYGKLYNWYTVDDSRNVCPTGWHVPTDAEWKQLEMFLGMSQADADTTGFRGTDEGGKLKEIATTHWNSPNSGATNSSGFTGLPGGRRYSSDGTFTSTGYNGYWWSATQYSASNGWQRSLYFGKAEVERNNFAKGYGLSVRCLSD